MSNWLPYYVLYMQQQQRAKKAEKEKKKAEEEAQRAREEAQQQEQAQTVQEQPTEKKVEEKPVEESKTETPVTESKPVEVPVTTETPRKNTNTPSPTECELLYEVGSNDYVLCEYTKAQNAQVNTNMAIMFLLVVAVAVGIVGLYRTT